MDAFFYILEGRGFIEIGDEQEGIVADQLIDSPARITHRLSNEMSGEYIPVIYANHIGSLVS